jgi:hypothetical protein
MPAVDTKAALKLTFFVNDLPHFDTVAEPAVARRIWVLPLRAQFFKPNESSVLRTKLVEAGKAHYIFDQVLLCHRFAL